MPNKQIFFDPQRKRWKRLRRILDATAVITTLVLAAFIFNVLRSQPLPELLLPAFRHNYKALPDHPPAGPLISPLITVKDCALPITCPTTKPATPH